MEAVVQYILSVTAASLICCVVNSLWNKSDAFTAIRKLLTGLFLALTVIEPLVDVEIGQLSSFARYFSQDADTIISTAQAQTKEERLNIIKSRAEEYILDEAKALNAELTVTVTLSADDLATPCAAVLEGNASPYVKAHLSRVIANDLGIPEEAQKWIG